MFANLRTPPPQMQDAGTPAACQHTESVKNEWNMLAFTKTNARLLQSRYVHAASCHAQPGGATLMPPVTDGDACAVQTRLISYAALRAALLIAYKILPQTPATLAPAVQLPASHPRQHQTAANPRTADQLLLTVIRGVQACPGPCNSIGNSNNVTPSKTTPAL
jgi:hypothetical protein